MTTERPNATAGGASPRAAEALHPMGSAAANRWRVGARTVDLVRTPVTPRPVPMAALPQDLVIDLARSARSIPT